MTNSNMPNHQALLNFAHKMADQSAVEILALFRQKIDVANKEGDEGFDPVTQADQSAERVMREMVTKHWPDHDFYGEEFENLDRNSEYRWVVDPIDGTRSFIMGIPTWGTLIGLKKSDRPYLGLMNQPFTSERYWTTESDTRYSGPDGNKKLATRCCADIENAILATTDPGLFEDGFEKETYANIAARTRLNRYGSDCYAYCMLASGLCDVIVEAGLQSFDIMALIPIVENAGGKVTTWTGEDASNGGRIVATGDPVLHEKVLALLND